MFENQSVFVLTKIIQLYKLTNKKKTKEETGGETDDKFAEEKETGEESDGVDDTTKLKKYYVLTSFKIV